MGGDWYRSTEWDVGTSATFETRLKRARADNRPQYLRIQAVTLHEAGEDEHARDLLLRVLNFGDDFEAPLVTEMLGEIALSLGDLDEAEFRYREVLARWPELDRTTGAAEVFLADVLSQRNQSEADEEALGLLNRFLGRDGVQWNNVMFLWHLVRLRIAQRRGDSAVIAESARSALALAEGGPQFPHHGDVGVVNTDEVTLQRLKGLARGER